METLLNTIGILIAFIGAGARQDDHRLPEHQMVIGVEVNRAARAYPLDLVRERGEITDSLGGQAVTVLYHPEGDSVDVRAGGNIIPVERGWWQGWSEFHPETDIFGIE